MSEETVVRLCAPTLAGLKTATLFAAAYQSPVEVRRQVRCLNRVLVPKGLRAVPLMYGKRRVQILAGTLIEVGLGKRTLDSVLPALETGDRTQAGFTAPAQGLCLMQVIY